MFSCGQEHGNVEVLSSCATEWSDLIGDGNCDPILNNETEDTTGVTVANVLALMALVIHAAIAASTVWTGMRQRALGN